MTRRTAPAWTLQPDGHTLAYTPRACFACPFHLQPNVCKLYARFLPDRPRKPTWCAVQTVEVALSEISPGLLQQLARVTA